MIHYSLDVWGTMIRNNPEFVTVRNQIVATTLGCSLEEAAKALKLIKTKTDKTQEETGLAKHSLFAWIEFAETTGYKGLVSSLKAQYDRTWLETKPLFNKVDRDALQELYRQGHKFSITSNTSMLSGDVLGVFIKEAFGDIFTEMNFSDLRGVAKPNPALFGNSVAESLQQGLKVIHFGDSAVDEQAATRAGIKCVYHKFQEDNSLAMHLLSAL